jgi:acyl-homoserine-lactone acylase
MTLFVLTQEGMNNGAEPMDALAQSVEALERTHGTWRVPWGDINRLQRVHTAGRETFRDDRPSVPVPGAPGWAGLVFTFVANPVAGQKRRYGVSGHTYVAVVEFARPVRARSLLVFGQSGDPSSPHYVDQAPLYSRGEFKTAWFSRAQVKSAARRTYHPGL